MSCTAIQEIKAGYIRRRDEKLRVIKMFERGECFLGRRTGRGEWIDTTQDEENNARCAVEILSQFISYVESQHIE